jgi:Rrf2 family cysteine metabolism transcriptional repressor
MNKVPLKLTYGILVALELGLRYGSAPVQAKVIAQRQSIPIRFIEQVLQTLRQGGVVDSVRGAQGGYSLKTAPSELSLADIVEAMNGSLETDVRQMPTNGQAKRPIQHEALLSTIWDRVRQAELEVLNSVTLESLTQQYAQLEQEQVPMYHI